MLSGLPIVDAHHHLWDLSACAYPWLMARGSRRFFGDPTPIQKNYLIADFLDDAAEFNLLQSVHVQVGAADADVVRETAWLQGVSDAPASRGLPNAVVAYCDLASPNAKIVLSAHQRFANVRGVRQILGRSPEENQAAESYTLLDNARWRHNLGLLVDRDLSFDLQLIPVQMQQAAQVLEQWPQLRVALCHCGSPWDQSTDGFKAWRDGLRQLARLPNVYCKLSGFGMFDPHWSIESIRPLIEAAIEAFGASRCMFGSNFPVEKLVTPYVTLWAAYDTITVQLSSEERQNLFQNTAVRFYGLHECKAPP